MIGVKYVGPCTNASGYASACRSYIQALAKSRKINLEVQPISFENFKSEHGSFDKQVVELSKKKVNPKIQIVHLTPENYPVYIDKNLYNIGYTAWEAESLPKKWISLCNMMDEIWVPSEWNIKVFKDSGVIKPVVKIPHIISDIPGDSTKEIINKPNNDTYVFYSVFQWTDRKAPLTLLKAYLTEFTPEDNIVLALKTYRLNATPQEQAIVKDDISKLKTALRLDQYPPILFFGNIMSDEEITNFHNESDCFVLPSRGEGFGIPFARAMYLSKPTIGTNYGGSLEFMNDKNSYLINYQRTPVSGMIFNIYNGHMVWAEPDIMHLRQLMRYVYTHREEAKQKGKVAQKYIQEHFSEEVILKLIEERLIKING